MAVTLKAWDPITGREVKIGARLTNFRGDDVGTLVSIDRADETGRTGKVTTSEHGYGNSNAFGLLIAAHSDECICAELDGPGVHMCEPLFGQTVGPRKAKGESHE